MRLAICKYVKKIRHQVTCTRLFHRTYLKAMQDSLAAPLQAMEHTDRHPLLSFISALFWVLRGSPLPP
jgi:hypothetical protein